jgi:S-DNA-T family DNA segregation ATPase FtsK/SpoIIIE
MENPHLRSLLRHPTWPTPAQMKDFARDTLGIVDWFPAEHPRVAWLGQEFNVRGQAMILFRRRISENALVIGGANAARYGILAGIIVSLLSNTPPKDTHFVILDRSIPDSPWNKVLRTIYDSVLLPAGFAAQFSQEKAEAEGVITSLMDELDRRRGLSEDEIANTPSIFVVMTELERIEDLRRTSSSYGALAASPLGEKLGRLCEEGPSLGVHLILSFSAVRSMTSVVGERRELDNFRHRVALQMSEDESHTLVRSRKASQLQDEGPVPICALYVDKESEKVVRFKPYSSDSTTVAQGQSLIEQLRTIGHELSRRIGES